MNKVKGFFVNLYTSGMDDRFSFEVKQKVIVINIIYTVTIVYMIFFGLVTYNKYTLHYSFIQVVVAILLSIAFLNLRHTQNFLFSSYFFVILIGSFFIYLFASGGVNNTGHMWSYAFPLFVMFLLGAKRGSFMTLAYGILVVSAILILGALRLRQFNNIFVSRFLASFFIVFIISYIFEKIKDRTHRAILEKNRQLEEANIRLSETKKNLIEQKSLVEEVFAGIQEGIGFINQNKIVILCNPAFADIFDGCTEDLIGKDFLTFFNRRDRTTIHNQMMSRKKGKPSTFELPVKMSNGQAKDFRITSSPRFSQHGLFAGSFIVIRDITKSKAIIKQLTESEEKYKDLVEKADIAILIDDQDGGFLYYNKTFARLFGYSLEEMKRQSIRTLVYADDLEEVMDYHTKRLSGEDVPSRYEFRGIKKDGSLMYLEVDAVSLLENQRIVGTRSYIWDVSDRRRSERLQSVLSKIFRKANSDINLEELFRSIHLNINEVIDARNFYIALHDREQNLLTFPYFVDEQDEDRSPYKPGKGLIELVIFRREALLINEEEYEHMIESGELELVGPPAKIWIGVPLKSKNVVFGVMVVQHYYDSQAYTEQDKEMLRLISEQIAAVIERKKSEQALKESEERYRDLVEKSKIGVVVDDLQGRVKFFNKRFSDMFGYTQIEMMQQTQQTLTHADDVDRVVKYHKDRTLRKKSPTRYELRGVKKDGSTLYLEIDVITLKDWGRITGTQSYMWDITRRKQDEDKLKEYQDQLEGLVDERTVELGRSNQLLQSEIEERRQVEKDLRKAKELAEKANQAKSDFLANVSHEIRTPINAILGFSELMLTSGSLKKNKTFAGLILTESNVLLEIINDLLDVAKVDSGKLDLEHLPFDLIQILKSIDATMRIRAEKKGLVLGLKLGKNLYSRLIGDPTRLRQILVNLIDNAIKFTEKGSVFIHVRQVEESDEIVKLRFEIVDTGIGISKKNQSLIFESFTQADGSTTRKYGGTGLGTTIAKQLVGLMDGEIGVSSELKKGSTFSFTAVFHKRYVTTGDTHREWSPAILPPIVQAKQGKRKERILLVEDYPTNQEIAKTHLLDAGFSVDVANNGLEAVEKAKITAYDLILMDVQMPEMDGYEACRRIRTKKSKNSDVPIIATTAGAYPQDRQNCLNAGMTDVIVKPIRRNQFLSLVNHVISGVDLPINFDQGVHEFGGKKELFKGALVQFLTHINGQMEKMENSLKEKKWQDLRREAHKIRGGALNLTANSLAAAAQQLEEQAELAKNKRCRQLLKVLQQEIVRLQEFLSQLEF